MTTFVPWTEERRRELQRREVISLAEAGAFKFTAKFFPYTSGQIGGNFIQSIDISKYGRRYRSGIEAHAEVVMGVTGGNFDLISGGESRDWDFSNPVAYVLEKAHAKLYKDPAKNPPLGADMKGKRIVHVADLQNEGSSIETQWLPQIQKAEGSLVHAVFYVDRLEDGVDVMKRLNVPSDAVVPLDEHAWRTLLYKGHINQDVYDSLNRRLENKIAWAHNALRMHVDHLEALLKDPKSRSKAEKVLNVGYPEIKDELLDRMKERGYVHQFEEAKK